MKNYPQTEKRCLPGGRVGICSMRFCIEQTGNGGDHLAEYGPFRLLTGCNYQIRQLAALDNAGEIAYNERCN